MRRRAAEHEQAGGGMASALRGDVAAAHEALAARNLARSGLLLRTMARRHKGRDSVKRLAPRVDLGSRVGPRECANESETNLGPTRRLLEQLSPGHGLGPLS